MRASFEMREPEDDPWLGRQLRFERLVRLAPAKFGLQTKLPSGDPITVSLGPAKAGRWWLSESADCEGAP